MPKSATVAGQVVRIGVFEVQLCSTKVRWFSHFVRHVFWHVFLCITSGISAPIFLTIFSGTPSGIFSGIPRCCGVAARGWGLPPARRKPTVAKRFGRRGGSPIVARRRVRAVLGLLRAVA